MAEAACLSRMSGAWHLTPASPLSDFVETLWLYVDDHAVPARERRLPTGAVELVIHLAPGPIRLWQRAGAAGALSALSAQVENGPLICGPHSDYFVLDTSCQDAIMGATFKPGRALPFIGLPAAGLRNQHASLADLWGLQAADLHEQVALAPTPSVALRALEMALLARCLRPAPHHPSVDFAVRRLAAGGAVSTIVDCLGISPRRFIDVFTRQIGLTPKVFHRVHRFQEALARAHGSPEVDWPALALDCGYFDQAHFIHDFQAFTGLPPSAYLARRGPHANHVPAAE